MEATFVIIGGGISGVTCAKGLGFLAPEESVILITSSPLIKVVSSVELQGKLSVSLNITEESVSSLSPEQTSLRVLEDTVRLINTEEKFLETSSKRTIKFKKLCICTGARPRLISSNPHVLGIRDSESVETFSQRISGSRKLLVVGNGGIATELVYKLKNVEIVWAIKDKHISATFVDPGAAEFFLSHLSSPQEAEERGSPCKRIKYTARVEKTGETRGAALGPDWDEILISRGSSGASGGSSGTSREVHVEYECEITGITSEASPGSGDWPVFAELSNGKIVGCDLIVSATGVIPNSDIVGLENLGRSEDGGLLVDWKMETSSGDIYAAGDVCSANWKIADHWIQMRLWTQAYQMGLYAAKVMASTLREEMFLQDFCFELFTHVTTFFGYKVVLLGLYNGQRLLGDYEVILRVTKDLEFVKLVVKGGKLQGAVLIGETDLEEMCENLILNQLDISQFGEHLLDPDVDIEDYFD